MTEPLKGRPDGFRGQGIAFRDQYFSHIFSFLPLKTRGNKAWLKKRA
jgi:hypothetical protein